MQGKTAIVEYFEAKMRIVKAHGINNWKSKVHAQFGTTHFKDLNCVCLALGEPNQAYAVAVFDVEGDKIKQFDRVMPELYKPTGTNIFPI